MLGTAIRRVIRSGFNNFWRNGFVSLASILIMTVALLVLASLIFSRAMLISTLDLIQEKVDINVYFTTSALEEEVLAMKKTVEGMPEVLRVEYSSREDELRKFRDRHANDELTLQSLDEIGGNPFGAALNIKAKDPAQYEGIALFLENQKKESDASIVDQVNYSRNKEAITALNKIISASRKLGTTVAGFFIIVSILITFNTIRLTIFISRDEIAVMRLVGASGRYIKGPFVVSGLMYGFFSAVLTMLILAPITYWIGPYTFDLGTGINLFEYYLSNFFIIFGIALVTGFAIGSIASYLAVKKYLKI